MSDVDDDFATRRVGKTLCKKYTLDALIGVGGMASVYRATHRNGNRVAIKVLHPALSTMSTVCARFLREGYVANAVDHDGAVRVLDDDRAEDGAAFLVMELLQGETVDARWQRLQRLPPEEVALLAHQLLDVLASAHEKGIIHRDIKPENLFLMANGRLKVLDFGIARMREAGVPGAPNATKTGSTMGTPAYMPKEQALGLVNDIDARTDLWAVGATMFALLSGEYVHQAETPQGMLVAAATVRPRSLSAVMSSAPSAIAAVVDCALAFEKEDRFSSARAMQRALEAAYHEAFGAPLSASLLPSRSQASREAAPSGASPDPPAPVVASAGTGYEATVNQEGPRRTVPMDPQPRGAGGAATPPSPQHASSPDEARGIVARPAGMSTTAGTSTERPAAPPGPRSRSVGIFAGVAGAAAVVGAIVFAVVAPRIGASRNAIGSGPSSASAATSGAPGPVPASASAPAPATPPSASAAASVATPGALETPDAEAPRVAQKAAPRRPGPTSSGAAPPAPPPPPPPPPSPVATTKRSIPVE